MGHSFFSQIAQKIVETYITHNIPQPAIVRQQLPIEAPLAPIEARLDARIFISLPVIPPNERVTEIAFNQAAELAAINRRTTELPENAVETVDVIYSRYVTEFPLFPELSPREASIQSEFEEQALQSVPITPPSVPITPTSTSPASSDTFVVLDLSP